jgi:hypothetical protein
MVVPAPIARRPIRMKSGRRDHVVLASVRCHAADFEQIQTQRFDNRDHAVTAALPVGEVDPASNGPNRGSLGRDGAAKD